MHTARDHRLADKPASLHVRWRNPGWCAGANAWSHKTDLRVITALLVRHRRAIAVSVAFGLYYLLVTRRHAAFSLLDAFIATGLDSRPSSRGRMVCALIGRRVLRVDEGQTPSLSGLVPLRSTYSQDPF